MAAASNQNLLRNIARKWEEHKQELLETYDHDEEILRALKSDRWLTDTWSKFVRGLGREEEKPFERQMGIMINANAADEDSPEYKSLEAQRNAIRTKYQTIAYGVRPNAREPGAPNLREPGMPGGKRRKSHRRKSCRKSRRRSHRRKSHRR